MSFLLLSDDTFVLLKFEKERGCLELLLLNTLQQIPTIELHLQTAHCVKKNGLFLNTNIFDSNQK